jgi:hypothetical protein
MRNFVAFGCAALAILLVAAEPAAAARVRGPRCALDAAKVENAMESAAELSALNNRVEDAYQHLQRLARGLDERSVRNVIRREWLCGVERQCGQYDASDIRMSRCLQDALRLRALDLEGQLKKRLESQQGQ